ncbi:MAG: hypothetical protein IBX49_09770, partial [Gammaproteobacteria bacterium]|nr:hypothetical protein [Gammaproteobacteria bacterium]
MGGDGGASWINRSAGRIEAAGGGGGARGVAVANIDGRDGGSGGGGSRYGNGGSGTADQGHSGGRGGRTNSGAGAGGGGGADGSGSAANDRRGGNGGNGKISDLFEGTYAGGGGGGNNRSDSRGSGGSGGGGIGGHGDNGWHGGNGSANTGSGGGGGGSTVTIWGGNRGTNGGNGGSGVVKIRFTAQEVPDTRTTTIEENGQTFVVHEFLNPDTAHQFVVPEGVTEVEYLVVGGGGAAGSAGVDGNSKGTGGGGAGGLLAGWLTVEPGQALTVEVGAGGSVDTPVTANGENGESGQSSRLGDLIALGGGGGGNVFGIGKDGGSGGGGGGRNNPDSGASGEPGQGFGGGRVTGSTTAGDASGGGGGGAGGLGMNGFVSDGWSGGGDGGSGLLSNISGEARWYAGGGGGGATSRNTTNTPGGGLGGLGGGGDGRGETEHGQDGQSGQPNTGGGGGGIGVAASDGTYTRGGAGGSGIVIVRYALPETVPERPNQGTVSLPELPRIKGGETAQVPVTLSGFDGAADLLVFLRIPEGGGTLSIANNTGLELEFGYDSFTGERTIGFRGSRAAVTTALAEHLEWTAPLNRQDVSLEVSVTEAAADVFYNPDNGHYYKPVEPGGETTWTQARNAAAGQALFGMTGYLATITSREENDFIAERVDAEDLWIGASDERSAINLACGGTPYDAQGSFGVSSGSNYDATHRGYSEGRWYWVTGPEACTQFWVGEADGETVAGRFASWSDGEPNDFNDGEHFAATNFNSADTAEEDKEWGFWNDFADGSTSANNYLIEFGGLPGEASEAHFGNGSTTLRSTNGVTVASLTA